MCIVAPLINSAEEWGIQRAFRRLPVPALRIGFVLWPASGEPTRGGRREGGTGSTRIRRHSLIFFKCSLLDGCPVHAARIAREADQSTAHERQDSNGYQRSSPQESRRALPRPRLDLRTPTQN